MLVQKEELTHSILIERLLCARHCPWVLRMQTPSLVSRVPSAKEWNMEEEAEMHFRRRLKPGSWGVGVAFRQGGWGSL